MDEYIFDTEIEDCGGFEQGETYIKKSDIEDIISELEDDVETIRDENVSTSYSKDEIDNSLYTLKEKVSSIL